MRMYAIIDQDGKVLHTWHDKKAYHAMIKWAQANNLKQGWRIAVIEPRILAERPLTIKGIDYILELEDV